MAKTTNAAEQAMNAATATAVANANVKQEPLFHVTNWARTASGAGYKVRASAMFPDGWHNIDLYIKDINTYTDKDLEKKSPFASLAKTQKGTEVLKIIVPNEYVYKPKEQEQSKPVEMNPDNIPF